MIYLDMMNEQLRQTLAGLYAIRELIDNGTFSLSEEFESELIDSGALEMDVDEASICLDEAIKFLKWSVKWMC